MVAVAVAVGVAAPAVAVAVAGEALEVVGRTVAAESDDDCRGSE